MGVFKEIAGRLWSGLDKMVAEIEDHDALVDSALRQLKHVSHGARGELVRVRADGAELAARLAQERKAEGDWRGRASDLDDDQQALECLRKARSARDRQVWLQQRLQEHARSQEQLEQHIASLVDRVAALQRQHHLMRTRTAHAEALPAIDADAGEIEEFFERWDKALTHAEYLGDPGDQAFDDLQRKQDELELRRELVELRNARSEQ